MTDAHAPAPPAAQGLLLEQPAQYVVAGWLVVLPNGWESLHRDQGAATQYAARSHGTVEPVYRKVKP